MTQSLTGTQSFTVFQSAIVFTISFTVLNYHGAKINILLQTTIKMCYLDFELRVFITDWKCG